LRTVLGRCKIHALPSLSIETLETWPHTHLLGSFGHDGSTSKCGIMRGEAFGASAAAEATAPPRLAATMAAEAAMAARPKRAVAFMGNLRVGFGIAVGSSRNAAPTCGAKYRCKTIGSDGGVKVARAGVARSIRIDQ
jgi:hypothetical protein